MKDRWTHSNTIIGIISSISISITGYMEIMAVGGK